MEQKTPASSHQPKHARPIKLISSWNAWQGTSTSHEHSLKIELFALPFQLWEYRIMKYLQYSGQEDTSTEKKSQFFNTQKDNQASFW